MTFRAGVIWGEMATPRIEPNKENCSLSDLEVAEKCTPRQQSSRRMTALRALLVGQDSRSVALIFNVSRRTLTRWVTSFNARGIDGLVEGSRTGRPRALSLEKTETFREIVENPELAGEVHWTARKFHGYLCSTLGETAGYSTVVRWLHDQNYRQRIPRPWPDRQDEEQRKAHLTELAGWLLDDTIDLWYADESGFEGDPRPRKRWVQRGSKPTRVKNGEHLRVNVIGVVSPRTGEFSAIEVPECNTDWFQQFLNEANEALTFERPKNLLILDNATWHKAKSIEWGRFTPIYLPAYSPDLNPIERLWLVLKQVWFSDFVAQNRQQLIDRLDEALLWAIGRKNENHKTCTIKTKL